MQCTVQYIVWQCTAQKCHTVQFNVQYIVWQCTDVVSYSALHCAVHCVTVQCTVVSYSAVHYAWVTADMGESKQLTIQEAGTELYSMLIPDPWHSSILEGQPSWSSFLPEEIKKGFSSSLWFSFFFLIYLKEKALALMNYRTIYQLPPEPGQVLGLGKLHRLHPLSRWLHRHI